MTTPFEPKLQFLPAAQRRLWSELDTVPAEFVLYGGTALALPTALASACAIDRAHRVL
jgi:hypothetical protein